MTIHTIYYMNVKEGKYIYIHIFIIKEGDRLIIMNNYDFYLILIYYIFIIVLGYLVIVQKRKYIMKSSIVEHSLFLFNLRF